MKRDLTLLIICLALLGSAVWLGAPRAAPVSGPSGGAERVVILDAGHGGEDGGASAASGQTESGINLAIVQKTEALMAFLGVETRLTRNADVSIHDSGAKTIHEKKVSDLKNRAAMINEAEGAVLISVHQNYFTDPRYSGAQVFFCDAGGSRQWGERTQEALRAVLDHGNGREVKPVPDNLYLFRHIDCPALLVECGFLSNGAEASLLLTDRYQRKIALALAGAYVNAAEEI